MARDDRRRLFSLGNMLWHSDSSFKPTPAKYSLLSARAIPRSGGNTEFADMRAAWDALDEETQGAGRDLVCKHSQIFSRGVLGFDRFTEEERGATQPVPQRLVRRHPAAGGCRCSCSHAGDDPRLAGAGGARLAARPQRARDAARSSSTRIAGGGTTW